MLAAALTLGPVGPAIADSTDLSSLPLITSAPQTVLPNLLFVLDDSGSMAWTHMPDSTDGFARQTDRWGGVTYKYGYTSSQCNGVYYNPAITYTPPKKVASDGTVTDYPNATFTAAWVNGFDTSKGTVDLSSGFQAWTTATVKYSGLGGTNDAVQAAYYYTYSGGQTTLAQKNYFDSSTDFYKECVSNVGTAPGKDVFNKVLVSSTSGPGGTNELQNFANWYSYYRTRMLMMKTSTGLAFSGIGNKYRVGYMSINGNADPSFLNIADFDPAQKSAWYSRLYSASPNNSTPLRSALSDAGRLYANKISSVYGVDVVDPVQYSCQRNITLLSTDGYWNDGDGHYMDGSTVMGNEDSPEPRPFNDGGTAANVYQTTITVSTADGSSQATSIKVDGKEILSGTATVSARGWGGSGTKLANSIASKINACTGGVVTDGVSPDCTIGGYKATASGNTVTITAPAVLGAIAVTPSVSSSSATITATAFSGTTVTSGGTSNTLADVAEYYYSTDLRDKTLWGNELGVAMGTPSVQNDVSPDNVPTSDDDPAAWQHMNTFTLGLGVRGRMVYSPTYKSDTSGDYSLVAKGVTPSSTVCSWTWNEGGSTCTWPTPGSDKPENIDDLWHAAVNGRGLYFSATDPASLNAGLTSALQQITAMTSDSAAATTSNPNITASNNYIYSSTFRSVDWTGELERRQIDPTTGVVAASADWTAGAQLDANTSRTIYTFDGSAGSKLAAFTWANLKTMGVDGYFTTAYMKGNGGTVPALTQFCSSGVMCITAAAQTAADDGALVDFLRGDRSLEGTTDVTGKPFRARAHVLGDIVDSEAVYVKEALYDYVDSGYSAFKTGSTVASRTPTVYVGANDGMLHAFNAGTGAELWAYVPSMLLPTLYRLADKFYSSNHQMYVNGSPTVGDAYFGGAWHTVLVGGLNGGGRGYYALDVTDPASPKALWEKSDQSTGFGNLGYSYGRPTITKLVNGTWVAMFTSGYNNVSPGDGQGYLYVVKLEDGTLLGAIPTGAGSATDPSGLAQISAWVDNPRYDNTTTKVYGGDLFGNLWRFDVNNTIGPSGLEAQNLATVKGPSAEVQSITVRPELGKVAGYPVIFVGTGRYLGATDLNTTSTQSIYAIKDDGTSPGTSTSVFGDPRSDVGVTGFVQQTLTSTDCPKDTPFCTKGQAIRTGTSNAVNFGTQKGWFVDLPGTRERATTDPQLALGTLAVTTNLLNPTACTVGGQSYANFFDYKSGAPIAGTDGMISTFLGDALATRPVQLKFADGTVRSLVRMSNNTWQTPQAPIGSNPLGPRRTSWRELIVN